MLQVFKKEIDADSKDANDLLLTVEVMPKSLELITKHRVSLSTVEMLRIVNNWNSKHRSCSVFFDTTKRELVLTSHQYLSYDPGCLAEVLEGMLRDYKFSIKHLRDTLKQLERLEKKLPQILSFKLVDEL